MKNLIQKAIDALEYHTAQTRPISKTDEVIDELKASLSAVPSCSSLCHKDEPCSVTADGKCDAKQPANHIPDVGKMVQAVNALAAQTGESPESITEWLCDKGGLTTLMLSHFGGKDQQPSPINRATVQGMAEESLRVFKDSCNHTHQAIDYFKALLDVALDKDQQPAQEPVKQEPVAWISNDAELPLKEDGKYWLYTERNTPHLIPLYIKQ